MTKVISGRPVLVIHQLLRSDPKKHVQVELLLKRVAGAESAVSRLTFVETCRERQVWRGWSQERLESGGTVALLSGRPKNLLEPITTLEGRENALS